jgi:hypothetical protein
LKSAWHPALDELIRGAARSAGLLLVTGDFVEDKFDGRAAVPIVERLVHGLR